MCQKHLIFQVKMMREKSFVQYRGLLMEPRATRSRR